MHKAQPPHWEKTLEPPHLGLCEGIAGVSKAALEGGQACLLRKRPEASSPTPVHPPPAAPAPGSRPTFAAERQAALQLHQQPSALQGCSRLGSPCPLPRPGLEAQPLWGCSQHGQREPRPGRSPGCLLKLSLGQRAARAKAGVSVEAYPALSWGAVMPRTGQRRWGWAAGGGWTRGETGRRWG